MNFFGGYQRKTASEVKSHLISKTTLSTGAGSIAFVCAVVKDILEEVEIGLHCRNLVRKKY